MDISGFHPPLCEKKGFLKGAVSSSKEASYEELLLYCILALPLDWCSQENICYKMNMFVLFVGLWN